MPEYAFILGFFLAAGLILQRRFHLSLYKSTKQLLLTNLLFFIVGVVWDHIAIGRGHWDFGERFLLGPRIGLMPIEEYGFTFIMPYFVLVVYRLVERHG